MNAQPRKIIHVDMDCFYAAIEIRDRPELANKPVAVGGPLHSRGVICTANYLARKFGVHSAMPASYAARLCKDLVILPVDMPKYRAVAQRIQAIFKEFTPLVEPLALDEAYLDVSNISAYQGSATLMAKAIKQRILESENLIASAGVAPNKFLAKIASGWKKPDGFFVIRPQDVEEFVRGLAVQELYGVGKVTAAKLHDMGIKTCTDLQRLSLAELSIKFGKLGQALFNQCHGLDYRKVEPNRIRKSLSVERTFPQDLKTEQQCMELLPELYRQLQQRLVNYAAEYPVKNQFIKVKFNNFKQISAEIKVTELNLENFYNLLQQSLARELRPIRLLGVGVHFKDRLQSFAE